MKEMLEETATTEMAMPPSRVWSSVVATLHEKYGATATLRLLPRQTAVTFVKSIRRDLTGGDVFRAIELTPTSLVGADDERPFLQFHYVYAYAGSHKRMVGFAQSDLLRLLKYPNNPLFLDCTFKVCPKPFSQVAIIMGYDPVYDLYLPIFYVLLQGKEQATYWHMFDMVIMQCDLQVEPRTVTCDFELGLLNAVREQFPGIPVVGCLFHWKQALRRKMLHLRIPTDVVSDVMRRGVIDVLTVIPQEDIVSKGIPFVRSKIDETGHRVKWQTFWRYFKRTWMTQYDAMMWNVHNISATGGIVNRTNNALEKFNRDLNESFPTAHPSLLTFIDVIKRKSREYVALLNDILQGWQVPPAYGTSASTVVPDDYYEFCSQQD